MGPVGSDAVTVHMLARKRDSIEVNTARIDDEIPDTLVRRFYVLRKDALSRKKNFGIAEARYFFIDDACTLQSFPA